MEFLNRDIAMIRLLIEEKNITRAAERAGLQQPALSKILMQLESKLERKLFSRTTNGLIPSPFAYELARIAAESEAFWSQSLNSLLEKETRVEGTFTIGCHSVIASSFLMKAFAGLHNKYPHLDLNLILEPSRSVTQKVVKGEIHFGLVANPINQPDLVKKTIRQENVYLYAHGSLTDGSVVYFNPEMIDVNKFTRVLQKYKLVSISDYRVIMDLLEAQENQGAILPSHLGREKPDLKVSSKSFYKSDIKLIYRHDLYKSFAVSVVFEELRKLMEI